MLSRRKFLINAAALALLGCVNRPFASSESRRKRKYIVNSPSSYWGIKQDFSSLNFDKIIAHPNQPIARSGKGGGVQVLFTIVDEDGGNVRRFGTTGGFHATTSSEQGLIYLISDVLPARVIILDIETLEVVSQFTEVDERVTRNFTGHATPIPGTGMIAFGMNRSLEIGKYGEISIRDSLSMKELAIFPSYGFDLHEIRLSQDKKYFVCGHYGSYYGLWSYKPMMIVGSVGGGRKSPKIIYPASATMVDVESGKLFRRVSDTDGGPHGHVDSDSNYQMYIPCRRTTVANREGVDRNPKFLEGEKKYPDKGEFAYTQKQVGIALSFDPNFNEVIVPNRKSSTVIITDAKTQLQREVDIFAQVGWEKPSGYYNLHGMEFHPDGKHYIVSTSSGFIAMVRGQHVVNKQMSIKLPLFVHTHMHIA